MDHQRKETIWQFVSIHKAKKKDGQRMGQRFVNMYIKGAWPELFHAHDIDAVGIIHQYLVDNSYLEELPKELTVDDREGT